MLALLNSITTRVHSTVKLRAKMVKIGANTPKLAVFV